MSISTSERGVAASATPGAATSAPAGGPSAGGITGTYTESHGGADDEPLQRELEWLSAQLSTDKWSVRFTTESLGFLTAASPDTHSKTESLGERPKGHSPQRRRPSSWDCSSGSDDSLFADSSGSGPSGPGHHPRRHRCPRPHEQPCTVDVSVHHARTFTWLKQQQERAAAAAAAALARRPPDDSVVVVTSEEEDSNNDSPSVDLQDFCLVNVAVSLWPRLSGRRGVEVSVLEARRLQSKTLESELHALAEQLEAQHRCVAAAGAAGAAALCSGDEDPLGALTAGPESLHGQHKAAAQAVAAEQGSARAAFCCDCAGCCYFCWYLQVLRHIALAVRTRVDARWQKQDPESPRRGEDEAAANGPPSPESPQQPNTLRRMNQAGEHRLYSAESSSQQGSPSVEADESPQPDDSRPETPEEVRLETQRQLERQKQEEGERLQEADAWARCGGAPTCDGRSKLEFEWLNLLGSGGFGSVIKVVQRTSGNLYALKKVAMLLELEPEEPEPPPKPPREAAAAGAPQQSRAAAAAAAPQQAAAAGERNPEPQEGAGDAGAESDADEPKPPKKLRQLQVPPEVAAEASTLAALSHKNIVRYYDAWMENARDSDRDEFRGIIHDAVPAHLYILMEYCPGRTLREAIDRGLLLGLPRLILPPPDSDEEFVEEEPESPPPVIEQPGMAPNRYVPTWLSEVRIFRSGQKRRQRLPLEPKPEEEGMPCANPGEQIVRKWQISKELCEAVHYIHSSAVIHRDLKPANIFLKGTIDGGCTVKVGDFGLTTTVPTENRPPDVRRTIAGAWNRSKGTLSAGVGTMHYMAPEQATSSQYDQSADIFSLGVCLFEIWALPFATTMERCLVLGALSSQTCMDPFYNKGRRPARPAPKAPSPDRPQPERARARHGRVRRRMRVPPQLQQQGPQSQLPLEQQPFDLVAFLLRYVPSSICGLLYLMLQLDPKNRPTAKEVLLHDFFICHPDTKEVIAFYAAAAAAAGYLCKESEDDRNPWRENPFRPVLHLLRESPFSNEAVQTVALLLKQEVPFTRLIDYFWHQRLQLSTQGGDCAQLLRQSLLDLLQQHCQQLLLCRGASCRELPLLLPYTNRIQTTLKNVQEQLRIQQQLLILHGRSCGKLEDAAASTTPEEVVAQLRFTFRVSTAESEALHEWTGVFRPMEYPSTSSPPLGQASAGRTSKLCSSSIKEFIVPQFSISYDFLPLHTALALDDLKHTLHLQERADAAAAQAKAAEEQELAAATVAATASQPAAPTADSTAAANPTPAASASSPAAAVVSAPANPQSAASAATEKPAQGAPDVDFEGYPPTSVYRVLGPAATPMFMPFALLPAAAAAAATNPKVPRSWRPIQKQWCIGNTYRTAKNSPLNAPVEALSVVYHTQIHMPTLEAWAASVESTSVAVAAYLEADVIAAAADLLAPIAAAAAVQDQPEQHFLLLWTCSALLPALLEHAFDVPPESVLTLDTWIRATAAAGSLTPELLHQQLVAIDAGAYHALSEEEQAMHPKPRITETSPSLIARSNRLWQILTLNRDSAVEFVQLARPILAEQCQPLASSSGMCGTTRNLCEYGLPERVEEQMQRLLLLYVLLSDLESIRPEQHKFSLLQPIDRTAFERGIVFWFLGKPLQLQCQRQTTRQQQQQHYRQQQQQQNKQQQQTTPHQKLREVYAAGGRCDAFFHELCFQSSVPTHPAFCAEVDLETVCSRLLHLQQDQPEAAAAAVATASMTAAWNVSNSSASTVHDSSAAAGVAANSNTDLFDAAASWTLPTVLLCVTPQNPHLMHVGFHLRSMLINQGFRCETRQLPAAEVRRLKKTLRRCTGPRTSARGIQWLVILSSGPEVPAASGSDPSAPSGHFWGRRVNFQLEHVHVEQWAREFEREEDVAAFLGAKSTVG